METKRSFDCIIIGAGSAGCALANRLSADPQRRVLVLEAGGPDASPLIHVPGGFFPLLGTQKYKWLYQTAPQKYLDDRILLDMRGKVLGGSSSINGMCYSRGAPEIFDEWVRLGAEGWAYEDTLPYFKRAEANNHGEDAFHGGSGPLRVTRADLSNPLAAAWVEAGQQAGFPYSDDHNGAHPEGFGPSERTIADGRRISSAVAYLHPARRRRNLTVLMRAHVVRVLFDGFRANGVEYVQAGQTRRAHAADVISCAGVFQSPQLLMLSGIGEADHLRDVGVAPVLDLKGVGQNLHDHVGTQVQVTCPSPVTDYRHFSNPLAMARVGLRYLLSRTGPAAGNSIDAIAYLRSHAPGSDELDLKFYLLPLMVGDAGMAPEHGVTNLVILTRPESRGQVRLRSADPKAPPIIDANYLSHPRDSEALKMGIRISREVFAQNAYDAFRGRETTPGPGCVTDGALNGFLRRTINPNYEAVGTCRMGHDELSVVDERLQVRGLEGLRVVDGSVMPRITSGDPNASIIMIAERAADLIATDAQGGSTGRKTLLSGRVHGLPELRPDHHDQRR